MAHPERLSCVLFHDVTERAGCMYATDSVTELLGWSPQELVSKSFFDLCHPDERQAALFLHYEMIRDDKAATLTYLRLEHKGDGYALCALSRSVAKNFVVGTISLATDDPGNARAALATGGVYVLTPTAHHLAFRRWTTRVNLAQGEIYTSPPNGLPGPFEELEPPSNRVALLLDRFTQTGDKVLHYSNDSFFPQTFDRGLFQFIPDELDRENLTKTMDLVRGWITNVEGPTAGPFATCQFNLLIPTAPPQEKRVEGILIATSDAVLLTLVPLS